MYQEYQDLDAEPYKPEHKDECTDDAELLSVNNEATPLMASSTSHASHWGSYGPRGYKDEQEGLDQDPNAEALTPNVPPSQPQSGELYLALLNVCQQLSLTDASKQAQ